MAIDSFILVNKNTGVTLFTKNYVTYHAQSEDQDILFSGALIAIQSVMQEIQAGKVQEINTEEYRILASTSDRFALFCVGNYNYDSAIKAFLDKIVNLLESWITVDSLLDALHDNTTHLLEAMYDEFTFAFKEDIIVVTIYAKDGKFGYQPLVENRLPQELERKMVGYLSEMGKIEDESLFFEYLPDGTAFLGYQTTSGYFALVNFIEKYIDLMLILSFKHLFPITMQAYIPDLDEFVQTKDSPETSDLFDLINKNIEDVFTYEFKDLKFFNNKNIITKFGYIIPEIISLLITGNPVALLSTDPDAMDLMHFISYVSGIKSIDQNFFVDYPHRLVLTTKDMTDKLQDCGFVIMELDNKISGIGEGYIHSLWQQINKQLPMHIIISQLRDELQVLFDIARIILVQSIYGIAAEQMLDAVENTSQKILLRQIIHWVNARLIHSSITLPKNSNEIVW